MRRANVWKKAACVALSLLYFLQIKPQVVQVQITGRKDRKYSHRP